MSNVYGPILPLQLDPRNLPQLVRAIQSRINLESGGALNDFTPASPLASISEGQAFAQAELNYYLNNLPEAFSLQWLRQLGIQRIIGSRANVAVTFSSVAGYQNAIFIPKNTLLYTQSGLTFILNEDVTVGPNGESASGVAISERWGTIYNVGSGEISSIEGRFLGLSIVNNLEAATGGRDLETIDEMKKRAFALLARRNLTTSNDFEAELYTSAPEAKIIKSLTYEERFNLFSQDVGGIFLVAGTLTGAPISESSKKLVIDSLKNRVVFGTSVSIIPPTVVPLDIVIDVYYDPDSLSVSLDSAARTVFDSLSNYFDPVNIPLGSNLIYQEAVKYVYANTDFISSINNFRVRLMVVDSINNEGPCAGFSGEESEYGEECLYNYSYVLSSSNEVYTAPDVITTYKTWKCAVSLTSNKTYSSVTFKYSDLYTPYLP